jgi:hypothetical protein
MNPKPFGHAFAICVSYLPFAFTRVIFPHADYTANLLAKIQARCESEGRAYSVRKTVRGYCVIYSTFANAEITGGDICC